MVFVLNKNKTTLNPCTNAKARWLIKNGYAVIHKRYPFTIRLKQQIGNINFKDYTLKFDPGSKQTGIAICENKKENSKVIFLGILEHRTDIVKNLNTRRQYRRSRKTRYRQARWLNRVKTKKEGWLPPSLMSLVNNIENFTIKYSKLCPINNISIETVRFDTQLMENPNIIGEEYQRGTLLGYELREYLLYKYGHECQYCKGKSNDNVLEIEHKISKIQGGTNKVSNLIIACHTCNKDKSGNTLQQWYEKLKNSKKQLDKERVKNIEKILKGKNITYKDSARVNSTRKAMYRILSNYTDNLEVSTGGVTKMNRTQRNLSKQHYNDALCVGKNSPNSFIFEKGLQALFIKAMGKGTHCRTILDKYGFPRNYLPRQKYFFRYQTGDLVKANVLKGKYKGVYTGRISCRSTGIFNIKTKDKKFDVNYKYLKLIQQSDGYNYNLIKRV